MHQAKPQSPGRRTKPPKEQTVRTTTERKDSYAAKNVAATVALKVASQLGGMKTGFATAVQSLAPIEIQIQGILNATTPAVPTIQYPFYLNFGRQLWALRYKGITGLALTAQAQALTDFYSLKGLTDAPLIAIAINCFNVVVT
jgi:hypothetical protein